jgi:predicted flap endonuclease-1-like 5' DNA nuclease
MFRKYGVSLALLMVSLSLSAFSSPVSAPADEGNPWFIWLIIIAVLAAFVAFVIWWWIYAGGEEEEVAPPLRAETGAAEAPEPEVPAEPDDLERIEGIGPKIAGVLQTAGIATFALLASTDVEQLRHILGEADPNLLRLADPATWPEQAGLAAIEDWAALDALQGTLHGGRRA